MIRKLKPNRRGCIIRKKAKAENDELKGKEEIRKKVKKNMVQEIQSGTRYAAKRAKDKKGKDFEEKKGYISVKAK